MLICTKCGHRASLVEFAYIGPADGTGPATVRRCPACSELIIIDELEIQEHEEIPSPKPWGLSDIWGRRFSKKDREVEK